MWLASPFESVIVTYLSADQELSITQLMCVLAISGVGVCVMWPPHHQCIALSLLLIVLIAVSAVVD